MFWGGSLFSQFEDSRELKGVFWVSFGVCERGRVFGSVCKKGVVGVFV